MFNRRLFKSHMALEGVNEGQVAECLGISTVTLWRKYRRGGDFRREEIEKLIEYLHIENPVPVFFAIELA